MPSLPPETNRPDAVPPDGLAPPPMARPITPPADTPSLPPDPMLLCKLSRRMAGLDLLALTAVLLTYWIVLGIFLGPADPDEPTDADRTVVLLATVGMGALAILMAVLMTRRRGLRVSTLGLTLRKLSINVGLGLVTAGAAFAVFMLSAEIMCALWPAGYEALRNNPEEVMKHIPRLGPAGAVALTIFVATWEEVAFRGFVLLRLRRITGSWIAAVVLSSAVFAVLHVGMQVPVIVIPVFLLGVLFCAVTIWRRSLIPAILGHFLFNLGQFIGMASQSSDWQ